MRRFLTCGLMLLMAVVGVCVFSLPAKAQAGHEAVFVIGQKNYTVDNQQRTMDAAPLIENGRTYTPVRYLALALGVAENDIKYDPTTKTVSLRLGDTTLKLTIGSRTLLVNEQPQQMDVPPMIKNGRTFLPARWVAEAFGYDVSWDGNRKAVTVRPRIKLPFFDDFSAYGVGQRAPFGLWKLGAGDPGHIEQQVQSDNKIGNIYHCEHKHTFLPSIYLPASWKDYAMEVDWKDGEPRIYFRLSDKGDSGYYVTKGLGYRSCVKLHKFTPTNEQVIAESGGYDTPPVWWKWRIEVEGTNIRVFINDYKLIDIVDDDPTLSSGGIGLGSDYGGVNFDNVEVEPIEELNKTE